MHIANSSVRNVAAGNSTTVSNAKNKISHATFSCRSILGVEGEPNGKIFWIGLAGGLALGVASLMEMFSIASTTLGTTAGDGQSAASEESDFSSERRLSLGKLEDDMVIAGMV